MLKTVAEIRRSIEKHPARSAWGKGVRDFAEDLFDSYVREYKKLKEEDVLTEKVTNTDLLNGAEDWTQYSWDGCALIYDEDICKALCSPSEQKRYRDGEVKYKYYEEWLDVQARALLDASRLVRRYANYGLRDILPG